MIYESDELERLATTRQFDAAIWAATFVNAVVRTPEVATDRETMTAWFATAVMNGFDRGQEETG